MSELYELTRRPEGKVIFTGTQDECVVWAAKQGLKPLKDSIGDIHFRDIRTGDTYTMEAKE